MNSIFCNRIVFKEVKAQKKNTVECNHPAADLPFKSALTLDDRFMADSLEIGEQKAFWVRQNILPNVPAHEAVLGALNFSWY
jgi:hypothetical protein